MSPIVLAPLGVSAFSSDCIPHGLVSFVYSTCYPRIVGITEWDLGTSHKNCQKGSTSFALFLLCYEKNIDNQNNDNNNTGMNNWTLGTARLCAWIPVGFIVCLSAFPIWSTLLSGSQETDKEYLDPWPLLSWYQFINGWLTLEDCIYTGECVDGGFPGQPCVLWCYSTTNGVCLFFSQGSSSTNR